MPCSRQSKQFNWIVMWCDIKCVCVCAWLSLFAFLVWGFVFIFITLRIVAFGFGKRKNALRCPQPKQLKNFVLFNYAQAQRQTQNTKVEKLQTEFPAQMCTQINCGIEKVAPPHSITFTQSSIPTWSLPCLSIRHTFSVWNTRRRSRNAFVMHLPYSWIVDLFIWATPSSSPAPPKFSLPWPWPCPRPR